MTEVNNVRRIGGFGSSGLQIHENATAMRGFLQLEERNGRAKEGLGQRSDKQEKPGIKKWKYAQGEAGLSEHLQNRSTKAPIP